ncbi:MAG: hypothetical protein ABIL61_02095 [candidate division WOR-3 bacterium]
MFEQEIVRKKHLKILYLKLKKEIKLELEKIRKEIEGKITIEREKLRNELVKWVLGTFLAQTIVIIISIIALVITLLTIKL